MKIDPDEIKLNDQERDELIQRVESNQLSSGDRQLLVKLIQAFFWVTFLLRESKIGIQRLKKLLFGGGNPRRGGADKEPAEGTRAGNSDPSPPPGGRLDGARR